MKNIISKKLVAISLAVALIAGASIVTANAAIDINVSDVPVGPAPPVVPASDFTATGSFSPKVVMNPTVVIPEPGTMFVGFAVLTYLLFSTGRRSRA